jgi:predicted component of type VI protein secretion system
VENEFVVTLVKSLAKLVEQRRALAKRDSSSDRNEGYAERIVSIQAAIDATERAISHEQALESKTAQAA